jgi:hypothetical protein
MDWSSPITKKLIKEAEAHGCEVYASDREGFSFTTRSGEAMDRILSPLL